MSKNENDNLTWEGSHFKMESYNSKSEAFHVKKERNQEKKVSIYFRMEGVHLKKFYTIMITLL
jgi:hypothetical protein